MPNPCSAAHSLHVCARFHVDLTDLFPVDCYHCQQLDPVLEGVAEKFGNKVTVIKIDSRSAHDLNRELKVRGTPTMLLFKDGQEITEAREDIQVRILFLTGAS
jgi:thiol-disulfide isomerase/thioredoxin